MVCRYSKMKLGQHWINSLLMKLRRLFSQQLVPGNWITQCWVLQMLWLVLYVSIWVQTLTHLFDRSCWLYTMTNHYMRWVNWKDRCMNTPRQSSMGCQVGQKRLNFVYAHYFVDHAINYCFYPRYFCLTFKTLNIPMPLRESIFLWLRGGYESFMSTLGPTFNHHNCGS